MSISKKPVAGTFKKQITFSNDAVLIDSIINKGGSSPRAKSNIDNKNVKLTLRLNSRTLEMLDNILKGEIAKKTRTSWIKEAIEEKILKDISRV